MTEYSMLASGGNFHRICFPEDWMQVAVDDDVALPILSRNRLSLLFLFGLDAGCSIKDVTRGIATGEFPGFDDGGIGFPLKFDNHINPPAHR